MAYGAEPAGPGALAHTIYVRPSRELIVRSWHWPACWHRAFEHATAELGLAAATCILNRLHPTRRLIAQQLSIEGVKFHLRRRGTAIPFGYLTSGTAEDMSFLEKTALCDWRLRMQKPPSNHLPDRCLN